MARNSDLPPWQDDNRTSEEINREVYLERAREWTDLALGANGADGAARSTDEAPDDIPADLRAWPIMKSKAMRGIVGDFVKLATKNSEADPAAVLAGFLARAGAEFGRSQYTRIGDTRHHSSHFNVVVGRSSRGRKGTADTLNEEVFLLAEGLRLRQSTNSFPSGCSLQVSPGPLSSGEGMVWVIRDKEDKEDGDPGVIDKRLLINEDELGAALRALQRSGNNLSPILRRAWDGKTLAPMTKRDRIKATDPHVCICAAITERELKELMTVNDIWNGFANRFQWFMSRRTRLVPVPKPMERAELNRIADKLAGVIGLAHQRGAPDGNELVMSNSAQTHWVNIYPELTQDYPGILGAVTSRQETHTWRLALTYAQLDGAERIEIAHLEAALALNRFAFDSACYLFGKAELDPVAQKILDALDLGPKTQTEINLLFRGHQKADRLKEVLKDLQERGRVTLTEIPTRGRNKSVWEIVKGGAEKASLEIKA